MAARTGSLITRQVKPLMSLDQNEARHRVVALYKACYRQIPRMVGTHDVNFDIKTAKKHLRQRFATNAHVKDIRVIDMLVIKGQQDLKEVVEHWAQPTHIMAKMLKTTAEPKSKDFMSKFLRGHE